MEVFYTLRKLKMEHISHIILGDKCYCQTQTRLGQDYSLDQHRSKFPASQYFLM